jgi:Rod binding domain-containing protein
MGINPMADISAAIQGHGPGKDHDQKIQSAARQFESVLLTQLMQVMWKGSPEMSKGAGAMYQSMMQSAFAEHLSDSGGIGLAKMIANSLGAKEETGAGLTRHIASAIGSHTFNLSTTMPQSEGPQVGLNQSVNAAANSMLAGQASERWAKDGALTEGDLAAGAGQLGESARNTLNSTQGYQGYYKCNLFAFELARRAGAAVPLSERGNALSFPSSNRLTQDASDGSLDTGWAKVATGASPAAMQDALNAGEAAFMLVGSGRGERHGHMAVIERPRSIEYGDDGAVRSIVFDGWEAQPDGAKHLTQRTWNRYGNPGGPNDRNGLERIEIIQLNRKTPGSTKVNASDPATDLPAQVGPLSQPDLGLSKSAQHPSQGAEDRS